MLGQLLRFSSVQVTHPRTPGRHQLLTGPPRVGYLSLPLCLLLSKHLSIQVQLLVYLFSPQETVSSMRQELGLLSFWFLCALHGAWLVYICWLSEQAAEGNCSSTILNSENKITLCTGHTVNARAMPLTTKAYPADLCSSYLVYSVRRMTPRDYYIP